jgi:hypothetical protein
VKSNHGGVEGKLPAGLTEVGIEKDGSTARKHNGEEAEEDDDEQESNEDINNEEDDEGVNEIMNLKNCRSIITVILNHSCLPVNVTVSLHCELLQCAAYCRTVCLFQPAILMKWNMVEHLRDVGGCREYFSAAIAGYISAIYLHLQHVEQPQTPVRRRRVGSLSQILPQSLGIGRFAITTEFAKQLISGEMAQKLYK